MACRSGKVKNARENIDGALAQIDKLEATMESRAGTKESEFKDKISASLKAAGVSDGVEDKRTNIDGKDYAVKVDYASEFDIDAIAKIVTDSLQIVGIIGSSPTPEQAAVSKEAIKAYTDVVNSVAEAAKSESKGGGTVSYSMSKILPGTWAFLYAISSNLYDKDTFGTETVTATAIFHTIVKSEKTIAIDQHFDNAIEIAKENGKSCRRYLAAQGKILDQFLDDEITEETFDSKDKLFDKKIQELQDAMDVTLEKAAPTSKNMAMRIPGYHLPEAVMQTEHNVKKSLARLSPDNPKHVKVIERTKSRLASGHFAF